MPSKINTFDIKTFDININHSLEASAGTGKTYSIIQIVKKILKEDPTVTLDNILIVTYTDKATGELKNRVRREIKGQDVDHAPIYTINSFCKTIIEEFGYSASLPFKLDVVDDNDLLDFSSIFIRGGEILSSMNIFIKEEGYDINSDTLAKFLRNGLNKYYLNLDKEEDPAVISAKLFDKRYLYIPSKSYDSLKDDPVYEPLYRNIEILKTSTFDKLAEAVDNLVNNINTRGIVHAGNPINELSSLPTAGDIPVLNALKIYVDRWSNDKAFQKSFKALSPSAVRSNYSDLNNIVYELKQSTSNYVAKLGTALEKKLEGDKPSLGVRATLEKCLALNLSQEVRDALDFLDFIFYDPTKAQEVVAKAYLKDFYLAYQEHKEALKAETYSDMIRYVRESLIHKQDFKKKVQGRFKYGIIDEFQDTNQLQFDVFHDIFMEDDGHHIIVVGDPKQSIYSFQAADIAVYLKAKKTIENGDYGRIKPGEISLLEKNYRATEGIVKATNAIFPHYDFKETTFTPSLYRLPSDGQFHAKIDGNEIIPVKIAIKASEDGDENGLTSQDYADIVTQQIIDLMRVDPSTKKTKLQISSKKADDDELLEEEKRPEENKGKQESKEPPLKDVTFGDFVILVRKKKEFTPFKRAFARAGIPFVIYKDDSLFSSLACSNWIALLEAIDAEDFTGKRRGLFRKALFTSFFGKSLAEISSQEYEKDDSIEMETIQRWRKLANDNQYEDLFDDILVSSFSNNLLDIADISERGGYKQIASFMIKYLSEHHTLKELIKKMKNLKNGDATSDDEEGNGNLLEISTDFDCVRMMTIHASKGLEFPVVIVSGGDTSSGNRSGQVYTYYDSSSNHLLSFHKPETADEMTIAEEKRLYYVALTRAKYLLILPEYSKYAKGYEFLPESLQKFREDPANAQYFEIIRDSGVSSKKLKDIVTKEILASDSLDAQQSENKDKQSELEKNAQLELIKTLIPTKYSKVAHKQSYSSLSHGDEEKTKPALSLETEGEDKEGEALSNLSDFDKVGLPVYGKLDPETKPIVLSPTFPKGNVIGSALHEIFELLDFSTILNHEDTLEKAIKARFEANGILLTEERMDDVKNIVKTVLNADFPIIEGSKVAEGSFKLNSLINDDKLPEAEFNFNLKDGRLKNYCNGFIDLTFRRGDYFSVLDWKSDALVGEFRSYSEKEELKKHVDNAYSIQRTLYSYCLVKWLSERMNISLEEAFDKHFGGVYYVFFRGCNPDKGNGIYAKTWSSFAELKESFDYIIKKKVR
ncbi:MAG: UvrD-helicase domain-containing protein [Bacilli bacterium]|nr:UvrD-helicase domain-containing protein [Bacilli bacterium]